MPESDVQQLLHSSSVTGRKPRRFNRIRQQTTPRRIELDYQAQLRSYVRRWAQAIEGTVSNRAVEIMSEALFARPKVKADQAAVLIAELLAASRIGVGAAVTDAEIATNAQRIAVAISSFNRSQINGVFRSALGINIIGSEPYLSEEIQSFVSGNVSLIKTIGEELHNSVEEVVYRSAREGVRVEELKRRIQERYGKSEKRAELIARDQTNKFNGKLTELRQISAGVKSYRWRTAKDERVRPEHSAREGKVFKWDQPPSDGHPGQPIQCRCTAEPNIEELL